MLLLLCPSARAEHAWGERTAPKPKIARRATSNPIDLGFLGGLWIYRNLVSPVDGTRCGMYPTCSAYGTQAIRAHGFLLGGMLAADRLMHEGASRPPEFPIVHVLGRDRISDPLSKNDRIFRHGDAAPAPTAAEEVVAFGEGRGVPALADVDAAAALGAARALAADGRPWAAVTEYRRAAFLGTGAAALSEAAWQTARAAKAEPDEERAGAAWDEADRLFEDAGRAAVAAGAAAGEADRGRALVFLARGYAREAQWRFLALGDEGDARFLAAWARAEAELEDGAKPAKAAAAFSAVPGDAARAALADMAHGHLSHRAPALAAGLSAVLPGAGFVYAGKPLVGLGSFVLNGLFLSGIYFSIRDHNLPLAGALLSLEAGWYFGGISGSAEAALARNDRAQKAFIVKERRRFLGSVGPGGVSAGLLF